MHKIISCIHQIEVFCLTFIQRCERSTDKKRRKNSVKLGKNAKNRMKLKEKAEILAQENFQKK